MNTSENDQQESADDLCDFNPFFQTLVLSTDPEHTDRLIGMLAYANYKRVKCDWVQSFRTKHKRYPKREDRQAFIDAHNQPLGLDSLRSGAASMLYEFAEAYAEQVIETKRTELRKDAVADLLSTHKTDLEVVIKRHTGKMASFLLSLLSNLVFTALLIVLVFVARNEYGELFDKDDKDDSKPPKPAITAPGDQPQLPG